jgi:hypothetical protein
MTEEQSDRRRSRKKPGGHRAASRQSLVDGRHDQIAVRMLAREVTQLMKPFGEALIVRKAHRQMAQREQRRDDASAIGVEIPRESVAFDQNPVAARLARREITAAVTELKEIPISAAIIRAEILEMRKYRALDDEHQSPKVSWQEFDTFGIRYRCDHDPRCLDVFHGIDLL